MTKSTLLTILFVVMLSISSVGIAGAAIPKVAIIFDDGLTSQYYYALPTLQANGQSATAFIITSRPTGDGAGGIGNNYMNVSQLNALYSAGWDLGSHTVNHIDLATLTPADMNIELSSSKAWLDSRGYTRASNILSYPFGSYDSTVITAVQNNGYIAARTVDGNFGSYPQYAAGTPAAYQMMTLRVYGVAAYGNKVTLVSDIKKQINSTVSAKGFLIITFHNLLSSGTPGPEDYSVANFKAVSDFLKLQETAGKLNVVTMSQYFGSETPPTPPPVPTKTFNVSGFEINSTGGSGINGWNVTLTNSTMQRSMLTGVDGSYMFANLVNGTYNVTEEMKTGWTNVSQMSQNVTINGADIVNINFTNQPPIVIPPPPIILGTYEYMLVNGLNVTSLNVLGGQGWELIAVVQIDSSSPEEFYLKRIV